MTVDRQEFKVWLKAMCENMLKKLVEVTVVSCVCAGEEFVCTDYHSWAEQTQDAAAVPLQKSKTQNERRIRWKWTLRGWCLFKIWTGRHWETGGSEHHRGWRGNEEVDKRKDAEQEEPCHHWTELKIVIIIVISDFVHMGCNNLTVTLFLIRQYLN